MTPADAGTASFTAITPVTTPYNYAVRTTRSPWTSALTANVRSDECSGAVTAYAGNGTAGFLGDGGAATAATAQRTPRRGRGLRRQHLHRRHRQQPDPQGHRRPA